MIDRDQLREAIAQADLQGWGFADIEPVATLLEAARLVLEGREVWWCESHEATGESDEGCWYGQFLADDPSPLDAKCRMVRMILIEGNTE